MEDELVIFKDLPDKTTPLNAYNLNHNFDVYNKQIKDEASKIDTTLEDIQTFQEQTEETINTKTQEFEETVTTQSEKFSSEVTKQVQTLTDDITTKTNTLQENITQATTDLQKQITDSNTELTQQISDSKTALEQSIDKTRNDLQTEIAKQIASISSLSILIVDTLPTEAISETTIYLIRPENLPSDVENARAMQNRSGVNTVSIKPQVYNLNNEVMTRESVMALEIADSDYYIVCFWVKDGADNHKWVAVGNTKIDLTQYSTTAEMNKAINDKADEIISQLTVLIPTKVSKLENDAGYLTSFTEVDPTVPSYVKGITEGNISSWNGKANVSDIPTKVSQLTNDMLVKCASEEEAQSKSVDDTQHLYYWVEE